MKVLLKYILLIFLFFILSCASSKNAKGVDPKSKVHIVKIFGFKFVPSSLKVRPGDVVRWINNDYQPHQVIDQTTGDLRSGVLRLGHSFSKSIDKTVRYICLNHPEMQGEIVVQGN
jgi:plastocyanin